MHTNWKFHAKVYSHMQNTLTENSQRNMCKGCEMVRKIFYYCQPHWGKKHLLDSLILYIYFSFIRFLQFDFKNSSEMEQCLKSRA